MTDRRRLARGRPRPTFHLLGTGAWWAAGSDPLRRQALGWPTQTLPVKVGVVPINSGRYLSPGYLGPFGRLLEELGFESAWTFEHVILPDTYESEYPYNPSGKIALSGTDRFVDPLIALSWIARRTTWLRLGTGVNILSPGEPAVLRQAGLLARLPLGRTG